MRQRCADVERVGVSPAADVTRSCPAGAELVSTIPLAPYANYQRAKFGGLCAKKDAVELAISSAIALATFAPVL